MWRDLESQIGPPDEDERSQTTDPAAESDPVAGVIRRRPERRARRVFRSSYLG
ncbi:MAG: hypothetical protein OJF62_001912 [Pseudolabrys sp.]|jgi:hypothetical protein|nr:hypothetical protein [Pseudolabrys sp.]